MPTEVSLSERQQEHASRIYSGATTTDIKRISVLDLLIILAERKRTVFLVTGAFAVLAIIISFLLPFRYTASVTLLPPQQNTSMAAALSSQLSNMGGMAMLAGGSLGLKSPNDMYVAMLKSRTVENAMVQRYGLMQQYRMKLISDAAKTFEEHTTIDGNGKDGLIHISVVDKDPKRAAELANGYVEEFRHLSEHMAITEAGQRRLFFEQQLQEAKDNLANAEEALKVAQEKTGMIQLDSQARALIESAASLRAQIAAKEVQIRSLQTFATAQNEQLVQAKQELQALEAQLAKLGSAADGKGDPELILPRGQVSEAGLEYVRKMRDVKYYETIFEILARQFEAAKLDEAKEGAIVQVVDPAIPPERRSSPRRGLIVICSTLVGFLVGIITVFVRAGLEAAKSDPEMSLKLEHFSQAVWKRSRA